MKLTIDIFGWVGMIMVVFAYFLVSTDKVKAQSYVFQAINVIGSIFIGMNALYYGALPSVGLNIVWCLIGVFTLIKIHSIKAQTH